VIPSSVRQIIDHLGLRLVQGTQPFARNLPQFILQTQDPTLPTQQLIHDAFTLHFAGNILMGLELCVLKEDIESFSVLYKVIMSSSAPLLQPPSSPSPPSSSSSSSTKIETPMEDLSLERFRPCAHDIIPFFLIPIDRHSYDPSVASNETRIEHICQSHGIRSQEWHETHDRSDLPVGVAKMKDGRGTSGKKIWKLIVSNQEKDHASGHQLPDQTSLPPVISENLCRKYDSLMQCVREILQ
jgi:hypothetical protein